MIEIYQLRKEVDDELFQKKYQIMLQDIETLTAEQFDNIYIKTGELDDIIKSPKKLNDIIPAFYESDNKINIPLAMGLFSMGDIVNLNGSFYIYYDPYNWKLIDVSESNE